MANKRDLKKSVNNITSELFAECIVNKNHTPNTDKDKATELMVKIIKTNNDFISRVSHPEPGNVKSFYKKFHEDFSKAVEEIIKEIDDVSKEKIE